MTINPEILRSFEELSKYGPKISLYLIIIVMLIFIIIKIKNYYTKKKKKEK